nr:MAG TPA: hypothetical protein [Caudoviricetes sp.]
MRYAPFIIIILHAHFVVPFAVKIAVVNILHFSCCWFVHLGHEYLRIGLLCRPYLKHPRTLQEYDSTFFRVEVVQFSCEFVEHPQASLEDHLSPPVSNVSDATAIQILRSAAKPRIHAMIIKTVCPTYMLKRLSG